ncbi:hypothetical protein DFH06DRAFT_1320194 [Mycena polygramma]|nr:hypothetical protein DFH06DRAFT_1320194 [Mycena polygramma]
MSALPSPQKILNSFILGTLYSAPTPECRSVDHALFRQVDPQRLHSLETLGDSRVASAVSEIQIRVFPQIAVSVLKNMKGVLLSNETFQHLLFKLEAEKHDPAIYCKGAGDTFEIYFEAFAQSEGDGPATRWLEDLFVPLVQCLLRHRTKSRPAKRRTTRTLTAAPGAKIKEQKPNSNSRRGSRNKENFNITLPSRSFTFLPPPTR